VKAPETAASAADRPKHHFVDLRSKRCFNKNFCRTPVETVVLMVVHILTMLNPRGKGCCFKHICLMTLHRCISQLNKSGCDATLKPANAWQCLLCRAMHSDDEKDGVERKCWVCGHRHVGSENVIDVDILGEESSSSTGSERVLAEVGARRLPKAPESPLQVPTHQAEPSVDSLSTSPGNRSAFEEPFLSSFKRTPYPQLCNGILELIQHWNLPRSHRSCCPKHSTLQGMKAILKVCLKDSCEPLWSPCTSWQCKECCYMYDESADFCLNCFAGSEIGDDATGNATTQTVSTVLAEVGVRRLPKAPESPLQVPTHQAEPSVDSLCTSPGNRSASEEPFLTSFKRTPDPDLCNGIWELIQHWNLPRNHRSCCPKHSTLQGMKAILNVCLKDSCDPLWSPFTSWQCKTCCYMNDEDADLCLHCLEDRDGNSASSSTENELEGAGISTDVTATDADAE